MFFELVVLCNKEILMFRVVAVFAILSSGGYAFSANCWKLGTTPCSTCGISTTCTTIQCQGGVIGYYCPSNATEQYRLLPAGFTVPSCDLTTGPGRKNCTTTNGTVQWCVGSRPCSGAGNACFKPPGGGPRFCAAGAGAHSHNVCGLTPATLSGGGCNSGF